MRYSLIMAGGSGTRLWPLSREDRPKQILPLYRNGSLLGQAYQRQEPLIPRENRYICAGLGYRETILTSLPEMEASRFLGEPVGRDTLNALGYGAAILQKLDPEAVMAVFTADHLITPEEEFRAIIARGFEAAEQIPQSLITFGITPVEAATGYGYLELGESLTNGAFRVSRFKEKPAAPRAEEYFSAGPEKYLWNSGMFIWKTATFLSALKKFHPENHRLLLKIADAWGTEDFESLRDAVFPTLPKISVDYAVMEPASEDKDFTVAALPMPLSWKDVGSWDAYAGTLEEGREGMEGRAILADSPGSLAVSEDPDHLIAVVGCPDLVVIHTPKATLVCPKSEAQRVKELHAEAREKWGETYL